MNYPQYPDKNILEATITEARTKGNNRIEMVLCELILQKTKLCNVDEEARESSGSLS